MYTNLQCTPLGGTFLGVGVSCQSLTMACNDPNPRACCAPDGTCTLTTIGNCFGQYQSYRDNATTCDIAACHLPPGACCLPGEVCDLGSITSCNLLGGQYRGNNTSCNTRSCPRACPCDWTADGLLYIEDVFNFLADFAAGNADFNNDGRTNTIDVSEFGDCFLHACR